MKNENPRDRIIGDIELLAQATKAVGVPNPEGTDAARERLAVLRAEGKLNEDELNALDTIGLYASIDPDLDLS